MKRPADVKSRGGAKMTPAEARKAKFRMAHPQMARRSMERLHAAIGRIMEEKQFAGLDEANEYLEKHIIGRPIPEMTPRTPVEAAQEILYNAWDEPARKKRIEMAERALAVSGDCADAFVLLAEETARTDQEARDLYEKGTWAGERALGEDGFRQHRGHFWGVITTRPYMRARAGLAECLWRLGQKAEAIEHYREMLALNPGDNQGLRFALLDHLIEEGRDREARELLDRYPDDLTAAWLFSKALLKFRREGPNPKTDCRLERALARNPYVAIYLLGMRKLPKRLPETIGIGDEKEAIDYVAGALRIWSGTPGALEWLARVAMNGPLFHAVDGE